MIGARAGTVPLTAVLVLGLALAAAPAAFRMFSRAPKGGEMLDDFRPYMTEAKVAQFQGYLDEIDAASRETARGVGPEVEARLGLDAGGFAEPFPFVADFDERWPAIFADMGDMLDTIDDNRGNYDAVDALPPFVAFPWFFVIPGLLAAGLATSVLVARRSRHPGGARVVALVALGTGLIAAPAVFQMFTRAPEGNDMIDDFRPLMSRAKVVTIQGYFVTIGNGEGELRNQVLPVLEGPDPTTAETAASFPSVDRFVENWPTINNEFAPMIGTMSDNVDNFAAVDALPPFALFPWFFVVPGLLVAALAFAARPRRALAYAPVPVSARPAEPVALGDRSPPT
jgi:hypothetical protein